MARFALDAFLALLPSGKSAFCSCQFCVPALHFGKSYVSTFAAFLCTSLQIDGQERLALLSMPSCANHRVLAHSGCADLIRCSNQSLLAFYEVLITCS